MRVNNRARRVFKPRPVGRQGAPASGKRRGLREGRARRRGDAEDAPQAAGELEGLLRPVHVVARLPEGPARAARSEERRVGKECRSRGSPDDQKIKIIK